MSKRILTPFILTLIVAFTAPKAFPSCEANVVRTVTSLRGCDSLYKREDWTVRFNGGVEETFGNYGNGVCVLLGALQCWPGFPPASRITKGYGDNETVYLSQTTTDSIAAYNQFTNTYYCLGTISRENHTNQHSCNNGGGWLEQ